MDEILSGIANYGFPIIITIYLLCRMEIKMENLIKSIHDLSNTIENLKWFLFLILKKHIQNIKHIMRRLKKA